MKAILSLLLACVSLAGLGAKSEIKESTVTLPYSELLGILERVNSDEDSDAAEESPRPPVDVFLQSAIYTVDATDTEASTNTLVYAPAFMVGGTP